MPEFNTWFPDVHLPSQGLKIVGTNVDCVGLSNSQAAVSLFLTQDGSNLDPGPVNSSGLTIEVFSDPNGHNTYSQGVGPAAQWTSYKHTWTPLSVSAIHRGAGQRNMVNFKQTTYGMGDSALIGFQSYYWGGPIAGDEGQAFALGSYLNQGYMLQLGVIENVPPKSTLDTTTTQDIVGAKNPQTVTVASTTGAAVGDWVVVHQMEQDGTNMLEPVRITAVGSGTISGVFLNNHGSGVKVKPALLLQTNAGGSFGQDRLIINLSGASYSTGTITSKGDTAVGPADASPYLNGTGMTWTNTMVGGDVENIGAICVDTDTYAGPPFHGTAEQGPLKSWHRINQVMSTTRVYFHTFSVASNSGYKGRDNFPSTYTIRPAVRLLKYYADEVLGGVLVCEYSTHTWSVGHTVECAMCPYADATGFRFMLSQYTPCGTTRGFMFIENHGARAYQNCINISTNMTNPNEPGAPSNSDYYGWDVGLFVSGCKIGLQFGWAGYQRAEDVTCAILLGSPMWAGSPNDNMTKIDFNGAHIMYNTPNGGLIIQGASAWGGAPGNGALTFYSGEVTTESKNRMEFGGSLRLHGWMDVEERGAIAAPAAVADMARIYTEDNGGTPGKTRLMVQFGTGAPVQLAIEP